VNFQNCVVQTEIHFADITGLMKRREERTAWRLSCSDWRRNGKRVLLGIALV
jgi:hypothetical protein